MPDSAIKKVGGLKGLIGRTKSFLYSGGLYAIDTGNKIMKWSYHYGGGLIFALATTSMVVFMPLLFEIAREGQVSSYSINNPAL